MNWDDYKLHAVKYRMEMDNAEYVSVLLLGIAEELQEYRGSVYAGESVERQTEEYGDMLWNIAELENILNEIDFNSSSRVISYDVTQDAIQAVRKHYFRDKDYEKLYQDAQNILDSAKVFFLHSSPIALGAMIGNIEKMKARHGK